MFIAVAFSSKSGLQKEYRKRFGDTSGEENTPHDFFAEGDSENTINSVAEALRECGHEVCAIEADENFPSNLKNSNPDLVFNIAEGLFGDFREAFVPAVCEKMGVPYTGSDPLTLSLCLNKARAKEILSYNKIPTPGFRVFRPDDNLDFHGLSFPVIAKPISEGSSKGIFDKSLAKNASELESLLRDNFARYGQAAIVESFVDGAEFTVAVWGNGADMEALPIVEINYDDLPPGSNKIYSYEAKWVWDTPEKPLEIFKCPARIDENLEAEIKSAALNACKVLGIRDWCRVDIRLDSKGVPNILELNPLPGILPDPKDNSCFPKAARAAGHSYKSMLGHVVITAAKRLNINKRTNEKILADSDCLQRG